MKRAILGSASRQPLINKCVGSAVLPVVGHESEGAVIGSAKHEHLMLRATKGLQFALDALPEIFDRYGVDEKMAGISSAELRSFTWMPPANSAVEIPLCLLEDGSVVRVEGGRGQYEDLPEGAVLPGQMDLMWSEPEPLDWSDPEHPRCPPGSSLYVLDYKTGEDVYVAPVNRNEQILALSLMAGRWTGAEIVIPVILFVRKGQGEWDVGEGLVPAALARIEERIRRRHERVLEQRAKADRGEPLELVEGGHCTYCEAQARCPAKLGVFRAILNNPDAYAAMAMTPDEAAWIAARLPQLQGLVKRARDVLEAHYEATGQPIDLGGGVVWGPDPKYVEAIDPAAARAILEDELGEYEAKVWSVSKTAIADAFKEKHSDEGIKRQGAAAMRRVLARLHEANAITKEEQVWMHAHRPKAAANDTEQPGVALAGEEDRRAS